MIRFAPSNAQHVGGREEQQDSFGFSDFAGSDFFQHGGFLAIVCDGMGGLALGAEASQVAVRCFLDAYSAKTPAEAVPDALGRALRSANGAVYEMATRAGVPGDAGTTLVALSCAPNGVHWISVGDSALFLYRDGALSQINEQHTYGAALDLRAARGEISNEAALSDPQREALTSYVGNREVMEVDVSLQPFAVRVNDIFVLASDGLFKTLSRDQIAATIAQDPESAAGNLVQQTIDAGKEHQDNVTVCTVSVSDGLRAKRTTRRIFNSSGLDAPASRRWAVVTLAAALALAAFGAAAYFVWPVCCEAEVPGIPAPGNPDLSPGP